eukprot:scaffold64419_cov32-Attheya_sp.AAC.1
MCRRKVSEACWGAPSFFSLHPVGFYMGIGTVSVNQHTCWYIRQLYHSVHVLTTYYSTDTDCRKQYLVLLFDPGMKWSWKRWKLLKIYSICGKELLILLREKGCLPKFNYDPYVIIL